MSDPHSKFEEDRTKIVVAIVDEPFVQTHVHAWIALDRQKTTHDGALLPVDYTWLKGRPIIAASQRTASSLMS